MSDLKLHERDLSGENLAAFYAGMRMEAEMRLMLAFLDYAHAETREQRTAAYQTFCTVGRAILDRAYGEDR
jgi:hypothetical protein